MEGQEIHDDDLHQRDVPFSHRPGVGFVSQNPIVSRLPALGSFRKIARQIATGGEHPKMSGNLWKSLVLYGVSGSCRLEPTGWNAITGGSLPSTAIYLFACGTSVNHHDNPDLERLDELVDEFNILDAIGRKGNGDVR